MVSFSVPSRAPNGLQVTSFEFTSDLLVEWNPLSQQYANGKLLGYTIYYRDYNIFWSTYKSVNTSNPSPTRFTLKGLKPAHEYLIAVTAFTSKGEGPWSAHEYAITGMFRTIVLFNVYYLRDTVKQFTKQVQYQCSPLELIIHAQRNIIFISCVQYKRYELSNFCVLLC